ncbi:hypothetical protein JCM13664_05610 [Methylothermus subterraneus]
MKRWVGLALILLLATVSVPAALLGLAATATGTRWLAAAAVRFVPGELRLGKLSGTLLDRLDLEQLTYRLPTQTLEFSRLTLAWQPKALLFGELKITELIASGVRYRPLEPSPPASTLPALYFPLKVTVERAEVRDAQLVQNATYLNLDEGQLSASLTGARLRIQRLQLRVQAWSASAAGEVALRGDYPLRLSVDWKGTLSGRSLAGQAKLGGTLRALTLDHRLNAPVQVRTQGTVNALDPDLPFAVYGAWENARWPPYSSPAGAYRAHGNLKAYRVEIDASFQGKAFPPLQIQLRGHGTPQSLAFAPLKVHPPKGHVEITGQIAWAPALAWQLALEGRELDLKAFIPKLPSRLEIRALSHGRWNGQKRQATLQIERVRGKVRGQTVEASGTLRFQDGNWQSDGLKLQSGRNRLELRGSYGKRLDLEFAFAGRDLSELWPGLAGALNAKGRLTGALPSPSIRAEAQGQKIAWQGHRIGELALRLALVPSDPASSGVLWLHRLELAGQRIESVKLAVRGEFARHYLELELTAPQGKLDAALSGSYQAGLWQGQGERLRLEDPSGRRLVFPGDGQFSAKARLDFTKPVKLVGRVGLEILSLTALAPWLTPLDRPEGRAQLELSAAGPIADLHPTLRLTLREGAFGLRPAGVRLTAVEATVEGTQERLALRAYLRAGEGRLKISGWAQPPARLHLKFTGENLEVVRTSRVTARASPELILDLNGRAGRLTGTLLIPEASLRLKQLPAGSVAVSEDERILGQAPPSPPFEIASKVQLVLGDAVHFQGFGLNARLAGQLEVSGKLAGPFHAHGSVDLKEAKFEAYGQKLTLAKGRLIFTGPLDRPYLELKASRTVEAAGVTAFLEVRGPATKPQTRIGSQPPLPQTEALSYLFLGRSFQSSSTTEQTQVAKAALAMGAELALPWLKKLGLEAFAAQTGTQLQEDALGLGKYLTPDLYIGYALSLFNGVGKAILRYRINRFLSLEAGAGGSQNVDLFYTLETD